MLPLVPVRPKRLEDYVDAAGAETILTEQMQAVYRERVWANAAILPRDADLVLIHDPQPAWLLAAVEEAGARPAGYGDATSTCPRPTARPGTSSSRS
jgi:hypothetical protein